MSQQDMDPLRDAIADELGLARDGIGYEEVGVADEIVAKYVAPLRAERDLLLWLHAEAVWQRDLAVGALNTMGHTVRSADAEARRWKRLCTKSGVAELEASRRDWAAKALYHELDGEVLTLGEVDQYPQEPSPNAPCSCLTAEQAVVVVAGGFSIPRCAVHPEADR